MNYGGELVRKNFKISTLFHNSTLNPCYSYHFKHIYIPPLGLKIKSNLAFSRADEVLVIGMKNIYSNAKLILMLKEDYLYSTRWHQRGTPLMVYYSQWLTVDSDAGWLAIGDSAAGGFAWSGARGFGVHSWLNLQIAIPVLFSVFFIFANGAVQSPWAFSAVCLGIVMTWGMAAVLSCSSVLMVGAGAGTGVGGIGQSFLVSNRFLMPNLHWAKGYPV